MCNTELQRVHNFLTKYAQDKSFSLNTFSIELPKCCKEWKSIIDSGKYPVGKAFFKQESTYWKMKRTDAILWKVLYFKEKWQVQWEIPNQKYCFCFSSTDYILYSGFIYLITQIFFKALEDFLIFSELILILKYWTEY